MSIYNRLSNAPLHIRGMLMLRVLEGELTGTLTAAELAIIEDDAVESPPTDEELNLIVSGCEQRILTKLMSKLNAAEG